MERGGRGRRALALVAAGCGSSSKSGSGGTTTNGVNLPTSIGKGEGAQPDRVARLLRSRFAKQFESADRLQDPPQVRRLVERDGRADARRRRRRRPVRPGLGLRRREPAADHRRRRPAGERQPDPELEATSSRASSRRRTTRSTASTTASRCSGARTCCSTTRTKVKPGADDWAALYDPKYKGQITVPNNPIQIADAAFYLMHSQPEPRHQRPVRAEQEAVRRDGRAAQAAAAADQEVLGLRLRRARACSRTATPSLGAIWPVRRRSRCRRRTCRSRRSSRRRARPAGPTRGCSPRRRRIRTAPTCG